MNPQWLNLIPLLILAAFALIIAWRNRYWKRRMIDIMPFDKWRLKEHECRFECDECVVKSGCPCWDCEKECLGCVGWDAGKGVISDGVRLH